MKKALQQPRRIRTEQRLGAVQPPLPTAPPAPPNQEWAGFPETIKKMEEIEADLREIDAFKELHQLYEQKRPRLLDELWRLRRQTEAAKEKRAFEAFKAGNRNPAA